MTEAIDFVNGFVWSKALIYLCLGAGLYFSIRTRFVQVRAFRDMLRLTFSGKQSEAGVSSFQALAMSLSGRIGIGNIAGVATAITFGGPGAILWMWVVAFLGASTAYVESTLAQIYKEKDANGQYRGGPAYYIEKAMGRKWYAIIFALTTVLATGLLLPGVQANGIAVSVHNAWGVPTTVSAALIVIALGAIIFGGVKRIAAFAHASLPGGLIEGVGDMRYAQTMAFTTLVLFSLFTVFNARSDERSAFVGLFSNKWLWGAVGLSLLLQAAVIYVPVLQQAFSTVPLSAGDWLTCTAVGSSVLWLRELSKLLRRGRRSR